uniref:GMP phosphodiesterase delta subunit domain-containing protein n=1 Tax=Tetraselmis chuii TaxID=63592 RepID=A0A7S1T542_9CHLO
MASLATGQGPKFKIEALAFSDADTGEVLWRADSWPAELSGELDVDIPARILKCKAVTREVKFSSVDLMDKLRMEQLVFMDVGGGQMMKVEEWKFGFGFVIPNSTNCWQSTTIAAGEGHMIDPAVATGKVVILTRFMDGERPVSEMRVRVHYVD